MISVICKKSAIKKTFRRFTNLYRYIHIRSKEIFGPFAKIRFIRIRFCGRYTFRWIKVKQIIQRQSALSFSIE